MVEFTIRIHPKQRLAYIPRQLYTVLGSRARAVPNRAAVLIFAEDVSRRDVLKSLDIIKADILHGQEMEMKKDAQT